MFSTISYLLLLSSSVLSIFYVLFSILFTNYLASCFLPLASFRNLLILNTQYLILSNTKPLHLYYCPSIQIIEMHRSNADADQTQGRKSHGGGHLPDLSELAFIDGNGQPRSGSVAFVANLFGALGELWWRLQSMGLALAGKVFFSIKSYQHAVLKFLNRGVGNESVDLHVVLFVYFFAADDLAHHPIGSQQQQAFRILIQTTNGHRILGKIIKLTQ